MSTMGQNLKQNIVSAAQSTGNFVTGGTGSAWDAAKTGAAYVWDNAIKPVAVEGVIEPALAATGLGEYKKQDQVRAQGTGILKPEFITPKAEDKAMAEFYSHVIPEAIDLEGRSPLMTEEKIKQEVEAKKHADAISQGTAEVAGDFDWSEWLDEDMLRAGMAGLANGLQTPKALKAGKVGGGGGYSYRPSEYYNYAGTMTNSPDILNSQLVQKMSSRQKQLLGL